MQPQPILTQSEQTSWTCPDWQARAVASVLFVLMLAWLFADLLFSFVNRWATEPQYSHGFLVPIMAIGLGWFLSDRIRPGQAHCSAWGFLWIVAGIILHVILSLIHI